MEAPWYLATNAYEIYSPALLVYPDRIKENIERVIRIAGNVNRLRPHVKTHKMAEVAALHLERGIHKFKCATLAEAKMLAEAAWKAATADEPPEANFVRAHALDYAEKMGVDMETAALRVFSNAEGAYGSNVNQLIASGAWGDEDELADAYEARKSFAYGRDGKSEHNAALLQQALKDVDCAYQNLESVELGVTTIDHYFDTLGGISKAVERARGEAPPVYIGDQTRGDGKVRTLTEQVALETRSRMLNPKWFEGLLRHGHEGVHQIESQITNTLGWSATTGAVEPWVYQRLSETFVLDAEMRARLAEMNPVASIRMANRLLEASDRDYWSPDADTLAALQEAADQLEDHMEGVGAE